MSDLRHPAGSDCRAPLCIGVLALQGGYAAHAAILAALGVKPLEVRTQEELAACDALILPGGESTTMTRLLDAGPSGFRAALAAFCSTKPVMGTCAGLIMLSKDAGDERVKPFGVLPVTVERNAYGRQNESHVSLIDLDPVPDLDRPPSTQADGPRKPYRAVFIRAPRISACDPSVQVLAREPGGGSPVLVRWGNVLGLSFHPELNREDTRIHEYFLTAMKNVVSLHDVI